MRTKTTNRTLGQKIVFAVMVGTCLTAVASAAPTGKGREGREHPREVPKNERPEVLSKEKAARAEANVIKALDIPRAEIVTALKFFKEDPEQLESFKAMLRGNKIESTPENALVVKSYIQFINSGVGKSPLTPQRLARTALTFTEPSAKKSFAELLQRATVLARENLTLDAAFKKALKEKGLEKKFDEYCKK